MIESGNMRGGPSGSAALSILSRRRYIIALPLMAGLSAGWVGYHVSSPTFVSEAVLALDVRRVQALPSDAILSPLPQDSPVLRTELDVIDSRLMASSVLRKLDDRIVSLLDEQPTVHRLLTSWGLEQGWMSALARSPEAAKPPAADLERKHVDDLLRGLQVSNDGRSYTIFISFASANPTLSAAVANAFAEAYLDHQIEVQRMAMRQVTDWLGSTLVDLRSGLEASEKAAEEFRRSAGLIQTNGATLQAQSVLALRTQLANLRADTAAIRARLETMRGLSSGDAFPAMAETLQSGIIQALRIEQGRLERQLGELRQSEATKSKDVPILSSQLDALNRQLTGEVDRQIESLENELKVMALKEASLTEALDRAQQQLGQANAAQVTLAQLEREAAANRSIYESFLLRYKQAIEQDGIATPEARVISAAEPATAPSKPKFSSWMAFGLGLGAAAAGAGTVLREATDHRWRLRDAIEDGTDIRVLATFPRVSSRQRRALSRGKSVLGPETVSAYALLRHALAGSAARGGTGALLVTSAESGEGKTTLVVGLARSAASAGMKVAIVDADMRSPIVSKVLGVSPDRYLDELSGQAEPSDIVSRDDATGIAFVAGRASQLQPEAVLNSSGFRTLLHWLESTHDLVLVDTPALADSLDVLDALPPGGRILFVASAETTPRAITAAVARLRACGSPPIGIVLTKMRPGHAHHLTSSPRPDAVHPTS